MRVETNPEAGLININTSELKILNGAKIEAVNNVGSSGSINIDAEDIELNGTRPRVGNFIGGISASTGSSSFGDGGNIQINTGSLKVLNGSIIRAISLGSGDAGNITINADTIEVSGVDRFAERPVSPQRVSKINTGAQQANGGNIFIDSDSISVENLGQIAASTNANGVGGEIFIDSNFVILQNQGQIIANTQAGTGGNITINSNSILGIENSDITANAIRGNGGNISINSEYIFGLVARNEVTEQNDITVSSELGLSGNVQLILPNNLTGEKLISLPQLDFNSSDNLISQSCFHSNTQNAGTIVNYGQNGIPENPENYFDEATPHRTRRINFGENLQRQPLRKTQGTTLHVERATPKQPTESVTSRVFSIQNWQLGDPIEEATVVKTLPDGTQYLVAQTELKSVRDKICQYKL